jgi:hypothetical protein
VHQASKSYIDALPLLQYNDSGFGVFDTTVGHCAFNVDMIH